MVRIPIKVWFRFGKSLCVWVWRLCVRRGILCSPGLESPFCVPGQWPECGGSAHHSTCRVTNHTARHTVWAWCAHTCLAPSLPLGKWQKQIATCLCACRREPPENTASGTVHQRSSNVLELWVVDIFSQNWHINYLKQFWCYLISTLPSKPIMISKSPSQPDRGNVLTAKGVNICIVPLVCRQRVTALTASSGAWEAKHTPLNACVLLPHSGCVYKRNNPHNKGNGEHFKL